jgi:hypothetical protein
MGWRSRLSDLAEGVADEARERASTSVETTRSGARWAAGWLAERDPSAGARLRLLADDDAQLSVERFLVLLLDAMNGAEDPDRPTAEEVARAGRRRARRAGILGIWGGPAGLMATSLYAEAMLVCDIVDHHGLELTDEQIAAHLLLLWELTPDLASAEAAIDGSGPSVAERLVGDRVLDGKPVTELSPMGAVKALWRLRSLMDPDELPGTTKLRHFALPKRRVRKITAAMEAQLGVSGTPDQVAITPSGASLDPAAIGLDG